MKLRCVKVLMISCVVTPSVFALSVRIPALDRVRKKVDDALQEGKAMVSGISGQGSKILQALGLQDQDKLLREAEKILSELHWSCQDTMVQTLVNLKKASCQQAALFLKDAIKTKCAGTQSLLVTFAHELAHEERQLQDVFNLLLKCLHEKKSPDHVKVLFDRHTRFAQNLQQLIEVSNALLMG